MDNPSFQFSHSRRGGFSLVEVSLAIGIIAFAFVALFALIPTGLTTYRSAIDLANETWILQGINSRLQTTDFSKIEDLSFINSKDIYYYDEEGKMTDREMQDPKAEPKVQAERLYAVKIITQKLFRPDGKEVAPSGNPGGTGTDNSGRTMNHGWRIVVVFAPYKDPKAMKDFKPLKDDGSLKSLPPDSNVHTRTFYVARMDSNIQGTP